MTRPEEQYDENTAHSEIAELGAIDALGLLTDRDRRKLDEIEERGDDERAPALRNARESVLTQMKEDLPEVDPDPSLKHRVLGTVLQFIEHDFERTVAGNKNEPSFHSQTNGRSDWVERLVAGRVSPVWRVAALIVITLSAFLGWLVVELAQTNTQLAQIARDNEVKELFERQIGRSALDHIMIGKRVSLVPVAEDDPARAMISVVGTDRKALFVANSLRASSENEIYEVRVRAEGVDEVVIQFTTKGDLVALDFELPDTVPNPDDVRWLVRRNDVEGASELVLESVS